MDNSETAASRRTPKLEDFPIAGPNSLASIGQRAAAWVIDGVLTIFPAMLAFAVYVMAADIPEGEWPQWSMLALVTPWVIYQILSIALWGRTLGMYALGLRAARFADGSTPDWAQSSMRALLPGSIAALPIPILNSGWIVVYLAALYNPLRRGLQDQAGGTIVVRTR